MFAAVLPEFIEPENCPQNTLDLSPVDHSVCEAFQQMVYHQKILDSDQLESVLLLDSAKPEPIYLRDQSGAKKTDNGYHGDGCPC